MRPKILICIALFAVAMLAVKFGAHQIVGYFGAAAVLSVMAALWIASYWYDHRERRR